MAMRKFHFLTVLALVCPAFVISASVREMSDTELASVRGGYANGACVDNGPCGTANNFNQACALDQPSLLWEGQKCDQEGFLCANVDVVQNDNIDCTASLGSGCENPGTLAPCVLRTQSFCTTVGLGTDLSPYSCTCQQVPQVGKGTYDACTPYAN
jgi:hypothetical protein